MWLVIFQRLRQYNLAIDAEGKLFHLWSPSVYKINLLKLIALILIGFMATIIRNFPYYPVTVVGSTIYARVVAACLTRYKIPFVFCRGLSRTSYYETEDGDEIPFEGASPQYFSNIEDRVIPLIPHSEEELKQLQAHTQLSNLAPVQAYVLNTFPNKNGVHLAKFKDLTHYEGAIKSPILVVNRFCGNMYYIMTMNEIWLTHVVFTDVALPIQPNDRILTLRGVMAPVTTEDYEIHRSETTCNVVEPGSMTTLTRELGYEVSMDFKINRTSSAQVDESIIYHLTSPRPFIQKSLYMLHPFHLPVTWDPFLTIAIVALALLASFQKHT
jgi:hypothetical protein